MIDQWNTFYVEACWKIMGGDLILKVAYNPIPSYNVLVEVSGPP
jgi:hypothetical protein